MDPVTHGLVGATAAQSLSKPESLRAAACTGFVAALLADLDILIRNAGDPLLNVEMHRQFTHSLAFLPVGALVATLLVWWMAQRWLSFRETYLFSLAGYATSGPVDAMTSYGTQLLWPFSTERIAWNIISVFDPLFTIGIAGTCIWAFYYKRKTALWIAWGWMSCYLLFGITQQKRARVTASEHAERTGHTIERLTVKPGIGNQVLWSIRYQASDSIHAAAVRLVPFSEPVLYKGESAPLLDWKKEYEKYSNTTLYEDIRRFSVLSEGWLIRHPEQEQVIGDGRYSMLPTSATPLWGIRADTMQPQRHAPFLQFREMNPGLRNRYIELLLGPINGLPSCATCISSSGLCESICQFLYL
ncbi:MAG: metal-dependent hydrolase [Balneolaceae bacterium]